MGSFRPGGDAVGFARTVVAVAREENITFMAGSIAYYAFVSLFPLVALSVLALAVVGGSSLVVRIVALTGSTLSPLVDSFLRRTVLDGAVSGTVGASLVGSLTLVWGSLKLFRSLNTAFARIYDTDDDPSFVEGLVDGVVVLAAVPVVLLAIVFGTTVLSIVAVERVPLAASALLVVGLSLVFLPMYYVLPDTDVSLREVVPGVVVAAVGWVALQQLFGTYVVLTGASAGTVLSTVLLFLTWLYFAGTVLLVGCVVNAVHGGYHRRAESTG